MTMRTGLVIALLIGWFSASSEALQAAPRCEDQSLATQGIALFYQTCGQGAPLLLLHGFQSTGANAWSQAIPSL